jgi:hypothetical protein
MRALSCFPNMDTFLDSSSWAKIEFSCQNLYPQIWIFQPRMVEGDLWTHPSPEKRELSIPRDWLPSCRWNSSSQHPWVKSMSRVGTLSLLKWRVDHLLKVSQGSGTLISPWQRARSSHALIGGGGYCQRRLVTSQVYDLLTGDLWVGQNPRLSLSSVKWES